MTKKHSTKRALIASVLILALCFSMLIGTTFAWFTDSVTSANNIIKSGNLDVALYYQVEGQDGWTKVDADTNVFMENALWEPGHTEVVKLKIVNEGSLALKYRLGVNVASQTGSVNVNGDNFKLSSFIKYGIVDGEKDYTREEAVDAVDAFANPLKAAWASDTIKLLPKTESNTDNEDIVTMVVYMPKTVGNEANYAKGEAIPTINLGINLYATQVEDESDSFGTDYDQSAPIVSPAIDRPIGAVTLYGAENVIVNLPEEVVDEMPLDITKLSLSVSKPIIDTDDNTVTFETVEVIDQNGNVVDIDALNAGEDITVVLPVGGKFTAGETVMIFHDGEYVARATVDENGMISYPAEHLCEIEVVAMDENLIAGSGTWGGIDWTLTTDGLLIIEPTKGEPVADKNAPTKRTYEVGEWREAVVYKSNGSASAIGGYPYDVKAVKRLVIEEGVTYIGSFTAQFPNLTGEVVIPSTVTYIGQEAFHKAPITKLTFAAGGTDGLCIANGAFKKLLISEVALPGDREYIHVHHWAFGGCTNLTTAYIPDNITKMWGGEHVDYFDNFNTQTNPTWSNYGSMFTGCTKLESIIFENEAARDAFVAGRQNSAEDYIVAYAGLVGYNSLEKAFAAAKDGDTVGIIRSLNLTTEIAVPTDVSLTLNLHGNKLMLNGEDYSFPANITVNK